MRRRTSVRLLTAATVATLLAVIGCSATESASRTGGPVIGTSAAATPAAEPVSSTEASEPAAKETDAGCGPEQMQAEVTDLEPSASNRSLFLTLYNLTDSDCAVTNPPIVELVGADGESLSTVVEPGVLAAGRTPVDAIPADFGVTTRVTWRVVPGGPDADPAADCVAASTLRLRLTAGAPPIDVPVNLTACDGGSLLVSPYDINAG